MLSDDVCHPSPSHQPSLIHIIIRLTSHPFNTSSSCSRLFAAKVTSAHGINNAMDSMMQSILTIQLVPQHSCNAFSSCPYSAFLCMLIKGTWTMALLVEHHVRRKGACLQNLSKHHTLTSHIEQSLLAFLFRPLKTS